MAKSFKQDMSAARAKINKAVELSLRGAALELFGAIVKSTPVGNTALWKSKPPKGYRGGRLRANWQTSIGSPKSGQLNIEDKSGSSTISREATEIQKFTVNNSLWFSNNLPYAERVEYGWSSQAPTGMVRNNVAKWQVIFDMIAKRFKV